MDLKPANICMRLTSEELSLEDFESLSIIDFGLSIFSEESNSPMEPRKSRQKFLEVFKGNILFTASKQLRNNLVDYRSDIESLFYIASYLYNDRQLPWFDEDQFENYLSRANRNCSITKLK